MYGELTDKETIARLEYTLENQLQDQFEVLLYKSNSKSWVLFLFFRFSLLLLSSFLCINRSAICYADIS